MAGDGAAARAFSDAELNLLERLNAMTQLEFVQWFRGSFEPSLHPVRVVTACNHILGGRLDRKRQPVLIGARWT